MLVKFFLVFDNNVMLYFLKRHAQSSSLSEKKALTIIDRHALELILNNQHVVARLYPPSYRQDSSNVEAISFWKISLQMDSNIVLLPSSELKMIDDMYVSL